jgi:hypothetical protein
VGRLRETSPAKLGPTAPRSARRQDLASDLGHQLQRALLDALGAQDDGHAGRWCGAKAVITPRRCWAGATARIRSQRPDRPCRWCVDVVSSATPGRNRPRSRRSLMLSTTSGSRACRVIQPGPAQTWARAVPQAPAPMTPACLKVVPLCLGSLAPAGWQDWPSAAASSSGQRGRADSVRDRRSPKGQPFGSRQGDHRGVVGAIGQRRGEEGKAVASQAASKPRAPSLLAATPPATTKRVCVRALRRASSPGRAFGQLAGDGGLDGVGQIARGPVGLAGLGDARRRS